MKGRLYGAVERPGGSCGLFLPVFRAGQMMGHRFGSRITWACIYIPWMPFEPSPQSGGPGMAVASGVVPGLPDCPTKRPFLWTPKQGAENPGLWGVLKGRFSTLFVDA